MKYFSLLILFLLACEAPPAPTTTAPACASATSAPAAAPSASWSAIASSMSSEPVRPAASASPAAPVLTWTDLDKLDGIEGRWIGVAVGDAIPNGPKGGKIVDGGVRAEFTRKKGKSKTPWNVVIWAPTTGHKESDTISLGCGFYEKLHADGGWRAAYCKGYGMATDGAPSELNIVLRKNGSDMRITIGHTAHNVLDVTVRRAP